MGIYRKCVDRATRYRAMNDDPPLRFDSPQIFLKLHSWERDLQLLDAVSAVVRAQAEASGGAFRAHERRETHGLNVVSEAALQPRLDSPAAPSDVGLDRALSNCIVFNLPHVPGSVRSHRVAKLRRRLDRLAAAKLRGLFENGSGLHVHASGHFRYPPGSYMGWHTNLGAKNACWRMYVSYVEEPGRSFFRYRDPDSGAIVTSYDEGYDFRLFQIRPDRPLWHAVYSETDRFSVGYAITLPLSFADRLLRRYRRMQRATRTHLGFTAADAVVRTSRLR